MTRPSIISRLKVGLMLSLVGLMAGFVVPGYCQDRAVSVLGAMAPATFPSWVPTGNLNTARRDHTATLLQDGRVLVVGGEERIVTTGTKSTHFFLDGAELYDPVTGAWTLTGRLSQPRSFHTATLLSDGRVLVAGGYTVFNSSVFNSSAAEIFDPVTGTWAPTGSMTTTHSFHTATLLQNGKVLVAGGVAGGELGSNGAELYDPAKGTWSRTGGLKIGRYAHTATPLQNGKVLVAGGSDDIELASTFDSTELYDPATGIWTLTGKLKVGRNSHTATQLQNGKVLVAGGWNSNSSELYDPATGQWTESGTLNGSRLSHTASLLTDGDVLVAGGGGFGGGGFTADRYNPSTGKWSLTSNLNASRFDHTATLLRDGRVLVAGGSESRNVNTALNSAELYDPGALPLGTIGPGFTGAWYDPAQGGHGLFVQVLNDNRLLAWWFTFNPTGTEQAWFGGVGTYSGNTATITAVNETTGGRWIPNFDPSRIVNNPWGTLTFTFADCNHGKVDFSSVAGYGTGSMNLTRLTQPAGLICP